MLTHRWRADLQGYVKSAVLILYHIGVVTLSGGIALSLPSVAGFLAENFMDYWERIKNEEVLLISIEIAVALFLILAFNYIGRSIRDRKIATVAAGAGLAMFFPARGRLTRKRIKKAKERHGNLRSVMIIGATGFRTLVEAEGDLHNVLRECLEAKIMLLNPCSEAALARARAILHPEVTPLRLREQIKESIEFLKQLHAAHKNVKLKLFSDFPQVKLAILGDYIWMQHYHANLDIQSMPEYVFKHTQNNHGLYSFFYDYFVRRWENSDIPEYDLGRDELVYGGQNGSEARRQKFWLVAPVAAAAQSPGKGRTAPQEKAPLS